jgi:hypothetical protein
MNRPNSIIQEVAQILKRARVFVMAAPASVTPVTGGSHCVKQLGLDSLLQKIFRHREDYSFKLSFTSAFPDVCSKVLT